MLRALVSTDDSLSCAEARLTISLLPDKFIQHESLDHQSKALHSAILPGILRLYTRIGPTAALGHLVDGHNQSEMNAVPSDPDGSRA